MNSTPINHVFFRFVPDDCDIDVNPGPTTLVLTKEGWEKTDVDAKILVYKDNQGDFNVMFES